MAKKDILKIEGIETVMQNLNKFIIDSGGVTTKGLIESAIHIRRKMETESPKIPVDTGNLRSSWFVQPIQAYGQNTIMFGFTANYAAFVHEMIGADFSTPRIRKGKAIERRKGAGPKFLEMAMTRSQKEILGILANNLKKITK